MTYSQDVSFFLATDDPAVEERMKSRGMLRCVDSAVKADAPQKALNEMDRWQVGILRNTQEYHDFGYRGFLKWWYPTTRVFLLKMIILGCEMGVPPFKEIPICVWLS